MLYPYQKNEEGEISVDEGRDVVITEQDGGLLNEFFSCPWVPAWLFVLEQLRIASGLFLFAVLIYFSFIFCKERLVAVTDEDEI